MSEKRQKLIRKLAKLEEPTDARKRLVLVKKYKNSEYTPSFLLSKIEEEEE